MRILFIHRSVGHNLIEQGNLRELLKQKRFAFDDYDNNNGFLTRHNGLVEKDIITMPGDNTNPNNLADFFEGWSEALVPYDIIMIKSCYPNSHIKSDLQLEEIKKYYHRIFRAFARRPQKQLFILTTPPLRPLVTNMDEAQRAQQLASWLKRQMSSTIQVFDLHTTLSELDGKHQGMLRQSYRRLMPWDNHPNRLANEIIAPELVEFITASQDR